MDKWSKLILLSGLVAFCCCVQGLMGRSTGGWGEWSPVSACSKTCDMGVQTRWREWIPGDGEEPLDPPYTNTEQFSCFQQACPQNGSWSEWGMWGECTVACGGGIRKRHRDCNNPPPFNGGSDCDGHKFDEAECKTTPCPPIPPNFNMSVCQLPEMFMCQNQKMCVKEAEQCDDTVQCSDGSDEMECRRYGSGYRLGRVHYSRSGAGASSSTSPVAVLMTSLMTWILMTNAKC